MVATTIVLAPHEQCVGDGGAGAFLGDSGLTSDSIGAGLGAGACAYACVGTAHVATVGQCVCTDTAQQQTGGGQEHVGAWGLGACFFSCSFLGASGLGPWALGAGGFPPSFLASGAGGMHIIGCCIIIGT